MARFTRAWLASLIVALAACGSSDGTEAPDGGVDSGLPDGGVDECEMPGVVCECDVDEDCGAFARCEPTEPGRVCACLPGYEGDPCTWSTVPADPGFQNMPTAWTTRRGVIIDPEASGSIDPGHTSFPGDALCNFGSVSQVVSMPPLEGSQPFAADVSFRALEERTFFDVPLLSMGIGGAWVTDSIEQRDFGTRSYCLGEAAYGGEVEIELSNDPNGFRISCPTEADLQIDHFQIVVAEPGRCPAPGEVLNGDFEDEGGWKLTAGGESATASIEEGVGVDGSRAAVLAAIGLCEGARMRGTLSVPAASSMPSPAIELWWKGTNGRDFSFSIDDRPWTRLEGNGFARTARYCVPPWMQGGVHWIEAELTLLSGGCAESVPRELVLDDIRIVNEPACGTSDGVFDPGFESAPVPLIGSVATLGDGTVTTVLDPALAHSGNGVLEVSVSARCASVRYDFYVIPPVPDAAGGPALRFWHRVPNNPVSSAIARSSVSTLSLPENGEWTEAILCLDPNVAGRPANIWLGLSGGSGLCAPFGGTEYAYFDDLELTTDASCPSE